MDKTEPKQEIKYLSKFLLKILCVFAGIILLSIFFTNINNSNAGKVKTQEYNILVTTQVGYELTSNILDKSDNLNLLTRDIDAFTEDYEVTPKNLREIRMADVIIYCGDEAEPWVKSTLSKIEDEDKILINMCADLQPNTIYSGKNLVNYIDYNNMKLENIVTKNDGIAKSSYTYWTNPHNTIIIFDRLYENLSALNSEYVDSYYNNYTSYREKLNELLGRYEKLREKNGSVMICCVEELSPYFINDLNLNYLNIYTKNDKDRKKNEALLYYYMNEINLNSTICCDEKNKDNIGSICENERIYIISNMVEHNKDFSYIDSMNQNFLAIKQL